MGSGLTLTNNEMEYIIKVIKSLKDRIILLKEIIKKVKNLKGGFLGNVLGPLIKAGSALMKNALATLAKSVLIPLRLTAAAFHGSCITTLIILKKEMQDIMHIVKSLGESLLLKRGVNETNENEAKE